MPQDRRVIGICPAFWGLGSDQERAGGLVHEAGHMLFNFVHSGVGSRAARGRNPECYTSALADTFGFAPFDTSCPPV